MALRFIVVVTLGRVLIIHHGVFDIDHQVIVVILDQKLQCIREFQGYALTVEKLAIGLGSAPSMILLSR